MFEYILLFQLCSIVDKNCLQEIEYKKAFPSHYECVVKGYDLGASIMKKVKKEEAEKQKLFLQFYCIESEVL